MSIRFLLANSSLRPDEIEKLNTAFLKKRCGLQVADRKDDALGELVARKSLRSDRPVFGIQRRSTKWWRSS
jgi:hypothetical protein